MCRYFLTLFLFSLFSVSLFPNDNVLLTFAGDLMAHDVNYKTEPLSDIYKGVTEHLLDDDLSFVNLEFPIDETRPQTSYPSFNVHPKYIEAAIDSGFDVFSLGNNHTNDYGIDSVLKTIINMEEFKSDRYISYSGLYDEGETDFIVETIQVKDMTIGFLSITQFSNNFWNKEGAAKIYTVDYDNNAQTKKLLDYIESISNKYDCLILSYHGGREYKKGPSSNRKSFFEKLVYAGVDILWGHHPHVLQPWELISTDEGDKLIMYSMGNFISGQLAIVDPIEHDINFAATGFSSLFKVEMTMLDNKLSIINAAPTMIANVRNENRYFVAVNKADVLDYPMDDNWKGFYEKMFPVAEYRIRREE